MLGVITLGFCEILIRAVGFADFPLYDADSVIGYIPAPSQSGNFLLNKGWKFNEKSMGGSPFVTSSATDTLILGDSIVFGGNPFREHERLAPRLQQQLGHAVWPVSAGSWSLRNELKYLQLHPDVAQGSDEFIFVTNNGDFDKASSWSCDRNHPRQHPIWATLFVFRKYIFDWDSCDSTPKQLLLSEGDWKLELQQFFMSEQVREKSVKFILYPDRDEVSGKRAIADLELRGIDITLQSKYSRARVSVYSVFRDSRWTIDQYRDGIHPTIDGTRILAEIIARPQDQAYLAR